MIPQGKVEKGWGFELVFANTTDYSGKLLVFDRAGARTSMMFHKERSKTWFVNEGKFKLTYIDTQTGQMHESVLSVGQTASLGKLSPHRLESLEPNSIIFEVGSCDEGDTDRIRLAPGDSQTKPVAQ